MPLYTMLIQHDTACKFISRSIPISLPSQDATFLWRNAKLEWGEANAELVEERKFELRQSSIPTYDKYRHRTKLCMFEGCKGTKVTGSNWTRHLKTIHSLSADQLKNWKALLEGKYSDVAPPTFMHQFIHPSVSG